MQAIQFGAHLRGKPTVSNGETTFRIALDKEDQTSSPILHGKGTGHHQDTFEITVTDRVHIAPHENVSLDSANENASIVRGFSISGAEAIGTKDTEALKAEQKLYGDVVNAVLSINDFDAFDNGPSVKRNTLLELLRIGTEAGFLSVKSSAFDMHYES